MPDLKVDPARVQVLSESIRNGANGIQAHLDKLDSDVKTLKAGWSGSALQAYATAQTTWQNKLSELRTLLEQISSKVSTIGSTYTQADNKSAGRFS